ncbi:MAG: beta-1,6-N-acetylglucosaminyltransferase [Thermoanaerobaculia bacterium]
MILVGHDGRQEPLSREDLPGDPGIDLFRVEGPVERGELSLLSPYFQAVEWLKARGIEYDWLVYLSGQDYPVRPLAASEARILASGADGFLRWWLAFAAENPWGRRRQGVLRYAFQYRKVGRPWDRFVSWLRFVNGLQSLLHIQTTYGVRIGVRSRRTPFHERYACYAGTQWTTLRRVCAEFVLETLRDRPQLAAYYSRTICSDESLVQTILVNAGKFRLINDNFRFVDVAGTRTGRPRTLRASDFERLVRGDYQFARKFDERVDGEILDRLDEVLFAR